MSPRCRISGRSGIELAPFSIGPVFPVSAHNQRSAATATKRIIANGVVLPEIFLDAGRADLREARAARLEQGRDRQRRGPGQPPPQRRPGRPVRGHLDDADPVALERGRQVGRPGDHEVPEPGRRGQARQLRPVRRAEDPLEQAGTAACSRVEKMPPPSLLATTRTRSGRASSGPANSPGASCRNARSPRRAAAGPPPAAWCASAAPVADEISPSMPLAPRLASTRRPSRTARCRSRSRMGRLDAAHSSAPSGRAAPRSRASRGSVSSPPASRTASTAPRAAASASCQRPSHPGGLPPGRRGPAPRGPGQPHGRGHVGRGARRVRPAGRSLGQHNLPGAVRRAAAQQRRLAPGQPGAARADDQVRTVRGQETRVLEQVGVRGERVAALPQPRTTARPAPASPPPPPAGAARPGRRRHLPPG